jgi:hypothetical protein
MQFLRGMDMAATFKTGAKVVGTAIFILIGCAFVVIAGKINYDASIGQGGGEYWPLAAIGATVLVAGLLKASMIQFMRRMYAGCIVAALVAVPFFALNWITASGNVASSDKHTEETRSTQTTDASARENRRQDAINRRDKADKAAGDETEASVKRKIEKLKADNPGAWNRSNQCEQRAMAKTLCEKIDALNDKADAAVAAEKARADLTNIAAESKGKTISAQSTSKGAGAMIKSFSAQLGYTMTTEQGEKAFEYQRGGCLELAAAIGPSVAWLLAWLLFWAKDDKVEEKPESRAVVERKPAPVPAIELPAVPHVAPAEAPAHVELEEDHAPAPAIAAAPVDELAADEPEQAPAIPDASEATRSFWLLDRYPELASSLPPKPPSPGNRTRNHGGKSAEPRGGNVIQFRAKKPTPDDVKALIASGKSHKEIEELLGISRSTIKRLKKAAS